MHIAEIARRAQGRADEVVGGEEAQEVLPHIVAVGRRSGRAEGPGRCGPPARAPAPAGSSLRDGSAVRPWESRKSSQRQVGPLQPVVGRILGTPVDQVQGIGMTRPAPTGWAHWHAAAARAARPGVPRRASSATGWRVGPRRVVERLGHQADRRRGGSAGASGPRWPPGSAIRQPLSRSASSSAIQKPVTVDGPACADRSRPGASRPRRRYAAA